MPQKTVLDLRKLKASNQRIAMITAYDATMARLVDNAGADMVLVGDSLGMVVQGHSDTLKVTLDHMVYHGQCVARGLESAHLTVDLPFMSYQVSPEQALVLASIIEKESDGLSDRAQISQVFHLRLKKNMKLQTDPTVIYALGESFDGDIRRRDLRVDSPFNTYRYRGLPPTPIALPSLASIEAALHPATGDYLYFVARGDGSSQFSRTLKEHNAAVRRYQLSKGGS